MSLLQRISTKFTLKRLIFTSVLTSTSGSAGYGFMAATREYLSSDRSRKESHVRDIAMATLHSGFLGFLLTSFVPIIILSCGAVYVSDAFYPPPKPDVNLSLGGSESK